MKYTNLIILCAAVAFSAGAAIAGPKADAPAYGFKDGATTTDTLSKEAVGNRSTASKDVGEVDSRRPTYGRDSNPIEQREEGAYFE